MARLPRRWSRREDFVAAIVAAGQAQGVAQWLATNLVADGGDGLVLRLDLAVMRALLADYFARDLWASALDPVLPGEVVFVIADRSATLDAADRARLSGGGGRPGHVRVEHVASGHWLHVEAPDAVLDLLARLLPAGVD
jgi:hypothetical protein